MGGQKYYFLRASRKGVQVIRLVCNLNEQQAPMGTSVIFKRLGRVTYATKKQNLSETNPILCNISLTTLQLAFL